MEGEGCSLREMAQQKEIIINRDKSISALECRVGELENERDGLLSQVDRFKNNFHTEQANWLDEKEKVIR